VATGTIIFAIGGAHLPDGSASNLAPAMLRVKSSASAPPPYFTQLAFDAAQLEFATWPFIVPTDYASAFVLKLKFKMTSATTGDVIMIGRLACVTAGDTTDVDAKAFDAANTSAATTVPATTAGKMGEISITMTNADSATAGDYGVLYVARDGASGSDTAAGDLELIGVALNYTTT
jgi:hypothetical protein